MNTKLIVFTLVLLLASQSLAEDATCRYFMSTLGGVQRYSCELSLNGFQGHEITRITGNHLPDRSDADVLALSTSFLALSSSLPSVVCTQFLNLEFASFMDLGITALDGESISQCHNLQDFRVSWNQIASIAVDTFANNRALTTLDLGTNRLESLPEGIFSNLTGLRILDLNGNRLDNNLTATVFRDLVNLEMISLGRNAFQFMNPAWFETNLNLRTLDLSWNWIRNISASEVSTVTALNWLFLGGNWFETLPREALLTFTNLTGLDLSQNFIRSLPEGAFEGLSTLQRLNMRSNLLGNLVDGTFRGLPALEFLGLGLCGIEDLTSTSFEGLESLQELEMSFNRIHILPAGVFAHFRNLTYLGLWNNRVTRLSRDMFFEGNLTGINYLDLEGNAMNIVDRRIFEDATNLETLRFINNDCASFTTHSFHLNRAQHMASLSECFRNFDMDTDEITTDNSDTYLFHPASYPGMMIRVQASGELHIALTPLSFPWQPMVEIVIGAGNNTRSEIRRNQASVVAMAHTPNIVNATGANEFTVTWANQLVLVSRTGEAFPFLGYMMEDFFRIHYHGLRTPTSTGLWNVRPF